MNFVRTWFPDRSPFAGVVASIGVLALGALARGQAVTADCALIGLGLDAPVYSQTVFDDGGGDALFVGGSFDTAGGNAAHGIARWNGSSWSPLGSGDGGDVRAMIAFDDGSGPALFVGGFINHIDGQAYQSIARWNGTAWSQVGLGMTTGLPVHSFAAFDDGSGNALYVGGEFGKAGNVAGTANIARWNGTTWSSVGGGMSWDWVYALQVFDGGSGPALYAGGNFKTAGGANIRSLAAWNGTNWSSLGTGFTGSFDTVYALVVYDDGLGDGPALYAGGHFTSVGGVQANRIARWDGAAWTPLDSGLNDEVRALTVFDDGSGPALFAAGWFTLAGSAHASHIAKWNGTTWSAIGAGTDSAVMSFATYDDGSGSALFVGGEFTAAFGSGDAYLTRLGCPGAPPVWTDLGSGLAGAFGIPTLEGHGTLLDGSQGSLNLAKAKVNSPAVLFVSLASSPAPFKGGTLVPVPILLNVSLVTSGQGVTALNWHWPPGIPSGTSLYFQYAVKDAAAVKGVALSNALRAVTH